LELEGGAYSRLRLHVQSDLVLFVAFASLVGSNLVSLFFGDQGFRDFVLFARRDDLNFRQVDLLLVSIGEVIVVVLFFLSFFQFFGMSSRLLFTPVFSDNLHLAVGGVFAGR
jgi:hypothetical protein